jgi:hypothetical protein
MKRPYEPDKLRALLEEKLVALKRYQALTTEMKAISPGSDLRQLNSLMFDRQKYTRKIQTIDKSINAVRQSRPQKQADNFSHNLNELYNRYRQDYLLIMEAIAPMDENIFFRVERESKKIKNELLTIKKNKHAVSRYGSNNINISKYLDTRK